MASENPKQPKRPAAAASPAPAKQDIPPPSLPKPPPLYRPIDWIGFAITSLLVFIGYLYTVAPDLTLEDSGEMAVASMYAGVPHPPGYPVWTIYSWIFTKLLPFSNIAWRVAVSSAFAGALACGLVALMVSRGSSMFIESVAEFKGIERRVENWICLVSGIVAGLLMGFNGFMWSQSVIVEVYSISMLSLTAVLACLLHWTYAPQQYRYLYLAWFFCGIAFNNHQSLLVITIAMIVLAIAVQAKLGRQLFFWVAVAYVLGIILAKQDKLSLLRSTAAGEYWNAPVMFVFTIVGLIGIFGYIWLSFKTRANGADMGRDALLAITIIGILLIKKSIGAMIAGGVVILLVYLALDIYYWSQKRPLPWMPHWRKAVAAFLAFLGGAFFYIYMPLASMSNPPLNWGYPRTVGGFVHAFTRGQYERIHPTTGSGNNVVEVVVSFVSRYAGQVKYILIDGPIEEFSLGYLLIGLFPLIFFKRLQARERAWMLGMVAFYFVLGPFLLVLFNPAPDRQSLSLNKPFFIASHFIIAMAIGYGLTLLITTLLTAYEKVRMYAVIAFAVVAGGALWFGVAATYERTPYWMLRFAAVWGFALAVIAALAMVFARRRAPLVVLLGLALLMPIWTISAHWAENEQRDHLFGFYFGHDMFTPPFRGKDGKLTYSRAEREELLKTPEGQKRIYPEMTKDTILFGGTDPGRFCPTYMIFCESFIPPKDRRNPEYDRRDVYIITQNALADGTYLQYIRAHYNRSTEKDVPFFSELMRGEKEKELNLRTNLLARTIAVPLDRLFLGNGARIEKARKAGSSFFEPDHFLKLGDFAKKLEQGSAPAEVSKYLRDNLSEETRKLLGTASGDALAKPLAKDLNRILDDEWKGNLELANLRSELMSVEQQLAGSGLSSREQKKFNERKEELAKQVGYYSKLVPIFTPARFQGVALSDHVQKFIKENPTNHSHIRLSRLLLEAAYPSEISKSEGGLYPDREIYTPSNEDSQRCFSEYMADAQQRMAKGQLRPGEDVRVIDNRVQVSGQVAVMAINALLAKVIFEKNPGHEFFIEESFPLEWMYPYLTPFGIIMKINRNTLPELTQEVLDKDHTFWSDYTERLIGTNVVTYDTPVSNIVEFVERVYVNKDYKGFKGDPRFVRDDDGQKAFSKLRSSIAGIYAWRLGMSTGIPTPPQFLPKSEAERDRLLREVDFAFKQAYAFCPYSPEALYRYVQVLAATRRFDDAIMLAKTSIKVDPNNAGLVNLVSELQKMKAQMAGMPSVVPEAPGTLAKAEAAYQANPADFSNALGLAQLYASLGRTSDVLRIADDIVANPNADATMISFAAQVYQQLMNYQKLETALQKWTKITPTPEAWLDYAASQAVQGKQAEALASLTQALAINGARLKTNDKAPNIAPGLDGDARFASLKGNPAFRQLLATNK
jgi:tetratricopeptide (TPR) repeat protein